jgi:hypothetical protein
MTAIMGRSSWPISIASAYHLARLRPSRPNKPAAAWDRRSLVAAEHPRACIFLSEIDILKEVCTSVVRASVMASAVARIIESLRQRGGLKGMDVANIATVSPATVSRWTAGKAFPHPKTQLLISDLRYVVDRLAEFYSPEETRLWLYARHRLLNGERPIDLIHAGRADEVLAVIESLDAGAYT